MLEIIALIALGLLGVLLLLVLFEPGLPYRIVDAVGRRADEADFVRLVGAMTDAEVRTAANVQVLSTGEAFYDAELAAIGAARRSVHIEVFIFHRSAIGDRFLQVLIDCARRGVRVRIVVDAIGSFPTPDAYFESLRCAGGRVAWYQPIRWYTLKRFNNRSHRNVMVIDGEIGFIGGAGIAAHWTGTPGGAVAWRDTVVRVTGSVVAGLQSTFLENWLEATGEILAGNDSLPVREQEHAAASALVVIGTPSPSRASRARVLFQLLLASATRSIEINSPYFLPDRSARRELVAAVQRGVRVRVIVPGRHNNHPVTRLASRRHAGELLRAGVEMYEYQPGMIHAKVLVVDACWSVVGSTNFDSRSFELNDEVNLALVDQSVGARLIRDFEADLAQSRPFTLGDWQKRSVLERVAAAVCIVLERQE